MLRGLGLVNEAVGRVIAILAILFAAIIVFDVIMRYAFNDPTRWAFDVTKQMFGFYFILLGGYALRQQSHVRVDLLTETLRHGTRRWVEAAGYIFFFFPFAWVFLTRSYDFAATSWAQAETTYGSVQLPVYPLKAAMCVAAALLLLQGIIEFLKLVLNKPGDLYGS